MIRCFFSVMDMTIFFFKKKTADEMRISYWNADVCSSDLRIQALCRDERLKLEAVTESINEYHFTQREPLREIIVSALKEKPKILQIGRASCRERVCQYV